MPYYAISAVLVAAPWSRAALATLGGAVEPAVPGPGRDAIRQALHEVASRKEFTGKSSEFLLLEWLRAFFLWLAALHQSAPVVYWSLLIGCVVLLALLTTHIVWTIRRILFTSEATGTPALLRQQRLRLWRAHREQADQCAARGDFTEAIRFLYLSLVYRLDESGRVLFRQALTNREYLNLFREQPQLQGELTLLVDLLDDHWYGQQPAERAQYERCLRVYDNFERKV